MGNYKLNQSGSQIQSILDKADKLPVVSSIDSGKYVKVDSYGNFSAETGGSGGSSINMETFTIETSSWITLDPSVSGYNCYADLNLSASLTSDTNVRIYNVNADIAFYTNEIVLADIGRSASPNFVRLYAKSSPAASITIGVETYTVQEVTPPSPSILAPIISLSGTDLYIESGLGNYSETYDIYVNGSSVLSSVSVPNQSTPVSLSSYLSDGDSIYATAYYNGETSGSSNVVQYSEGGTLNPPTISLSGSTLTISPASGTPAGATFGIGYRLAGDDEYITLTQTSSPSVDLSSPMYQYQLQSGNTYDISARTYYNESYSDWNSQPESYEIPPFTGLNYYRKYSPDPNTDEITLPQGTYTYVSPVIVGPTNEIVYNNQFMLLDTIYTICEDKKALVTGPSVYVFNNNNEVDINMTVYTLNTPTQGMPYLTYVNASTEDTDYIYMTQDPETYEYYFNIGGFDYSLQDGVIIDNRGIGYPIDHSQMTPQVSINNDTYVLYNYGQLMDENNQCYPINNEINRYTVEIGSGAGSYYIVKFNDNQEQLSINSLLGYNSRVSMTWDQLTALQPSPVETGSSSELIINNAYLPTQDQGLDQSYYYYELFIPSEFDTITNNNFYDCVVQELNFTAYIDSIGFTPFDNSSVLKAYDCYRNADNRNPIYPNTVKLGITYTKKYNFQSTGNSYQVTTPDGETLQYIKDISTDTVVLQNLRTSDSYELGVYPYITVNNSNYAVQYSNDVSQYGAEYGNQPLYLTEYNPIFESDSNGMNFATWPLLESMGAVSTTDDGSGNIHLSVNDSYLPISDPQGYVTDYYYELAIPNIVNVAVNQNFSTCCIQKLYFTGELIDIDPDAFGNNTLLAFQNYNQDERFEIQNIWPGQDSIQFIVGLSDLINKSWELEVYPIDNVMLRMSPNPTDLTYWCPVLRVDTLYEWEARLYDTTNPENPQLLDTDNGTFNPYDPTSTPVNINFTI